MLAYVLLRVSMKFMSLMTQVHEVQASNYRRMCMGRRVRYSALAVINLFYRRPILSRMLWGTLCDNRLCKSLVAKSLPHAGHPFCLQPSHSQKELKLESTPGTLGEKPKRCKEHRGCRNCLGSRKWRLRLRKFCPLQGVSVCPPRRQVWMPRAAGGRAVSVSRLGLVESFFFLRTTNTYLLGQRTLCSLTTLVACGNSRSKLIMLHI